MLTWLPLHGSPAGAQPDRMRLHYLLLALLPACSLYDTDDQPVPLVCDEATTSRSYRIDDLTLPVNSADAEELGFDFDDDGTIDNQGGNIMSAVYQATLVDLQGAVDEELAADQVLIGLTVEECGAPSYATVSLNRGLSIDRSVEPPVLEVAQVTQRAAVTQGALPAYATGGIARFPVAQLLHASVEDWIESLDVVAMVDSISDDEIVGRLAAVLDADPAYETVTLAFARKMEDRIAELGPCTPEACDQVIRDMLDIFDENEDGVITLDEVRDSSITRTLLRPDVDTDGNGESDALSIGVGFHASRVDLAL